jgi:hypothetical protein
MLFNQISQQVSIALRERHIHDEERRCALRIA